MPEPPVRDPRAPSIRRAPQVQSSGVGPRDLQRGALEAALIDLRQASGPWHPRRRTAPRAIRYYPGPVGLVCAAISSAGIVGFGCARSDHADAGNFEPTPAWRECVTRELREAVWPLRDDTGMPRAR